MEYKFDRIADKFRFQRNMNDADMLATARAFITEAGPYANKLLIRSVPDGDKCNSVGRIPTKQFDVDRVPERDKLFRLRHASLTGTRAFLRIDRRVAPDTIGCVPFRDAEHVAATADTSAKIREGMIAVRTVDGIVQNKYTNDPGKLAAWLSAKHVEKAPKKKAPPTP